MTMNEQIRAILAECQAANTSLNFTDAGSGSLAGRYKTPGRPLPGTRGVFKFVKFSEVVALRSRNDWTVNGMAISSYADHSPKTFSIDTDSSASKVKIMLNADAWESSDASEIEFFNSTSTDELLVRFKREMPANNNSRVIMAASSFIYVRDSSGFTGQNS